MLPRMACQQPAWFLHMKEGVAFAATTTTVTATTRYGYIYYVRVIAIHIGGAQHADHHLRSCYVWQSETLCCCCLL